MKITSKAYILLENWAQYKDLHYSRKTQFSNAVDIEIQKDLVAQSAALLYESLISDSCPDEHLLILTNTLAEQLKVFKDQITFELIRNGIDIKL